MNTRPARISPSDIPDDVQVCFSCWSKSMLEMADWIGAAATLRLTAAFGGQHLYVPLSIAVDHPIAQAIGIDAAQRLAYAYGRDRLDLPTGKAALAKAVQPS